MHWWTKQQWYLFEPNKMLAKLRNAVEYLRGMADIGNPTEFILEQLEWAEY
jgi:hypothetical protein